MMKSELTSKHVIAPAAAPTLLGPKIEKLLIFGHGDSNMMSGVNSGGMWRMHSPPVIFNTVFDEYNFSVISNLFDNSTSYALSTHKSEMCKQNASYRYYVKNSELRAKSLNKTCVRNCSKSTKMAITV